MYKINYVYNLKLSVSQYKYIYYIKLRNLNIVPNYNFKLLKSEIVKHMKKSAFCKNIVC